MNSLEMSVDRAIEILSKFVYGGAATFDQDFKDAEKLAIKILIKEKLSESDSKLVDIIDEALAELAHKECPYCQAYIGLDKWIDRKDIEKWLKQREK